MSIDQELLMVSDALIRTVADHVTVRAEQYAQIQALAARVQEMREALKWINKYPSKPSEELGYVGCRRVAGEALSTPDTSAQILARRDATIWMEAAEVLKQQHTFLTVAGMTSEQLLRAKADELLKGLEKEHG